MEWKEFDNPENKDYDVHCFEEGKNLAQQDKNESQEQIIIKQLLDEYGFLEDEDLIQAGISLNEYLNPTMETVEKIKIYLENMRDKGPSL